MNNTHEPIPTGAPPLADPRSPELNNELAAALSDGRADYPPVRKGFITLLALGLFGVYLAFVTPIAISLAIRVKALAPDHEEYLGLVLGLGSVAALITGPLGGVLSDRTRSRFGRRRPWLIGGTLVGLVGLTVMAASPTVVSRHRMDRSRQRPQPYVEHVPHCPGRPAARIQRGKVGAITGFATMVAPVSVRSSAGWSPPSRSSSSWSRGGRPHLRAHLLPRYKDPDSRRLTFDDKLSLRETVAPSTSSTRRSTRTLAGTGSAASCSSSPSLSARSYTAYFFASRLNVPVDSAASSRPSVALGILATIGGVFLGGFLSDKLRRRKPFVLGAGVVFGLGAIVTLSAPDLPSC